MSASMSLFSASSRIWRNSVDSPSASTLNWRLQISHPVPPNLSNLNNPLLRYLARFASEAARNASHQPNRLLRRLHNLLLEPPEHARHAPHHLYELL